MNKFGNEEKEVIEIEEWNIIKSKLKIEDLEIKKEILGLKSCLRKLDIKIEEGFEGIDDLIKDDLGRRRERRKEKEGNIEDMIKLYIIREMKKNGNERERILRKIEKKIGIGGIRWKENKKKIEERRRRKKRIMKVGGGVEDRLRRRRRKIGKERMKLIDDKRSVIKRKSGMSEEEKIVLIIEMEGVRIIEGLNKSEREIRKLKNSEDKLRVEGMEDKDEMEEKEMVENGMFVKIGKKWECRIKIKEVIGIRVRWKGFWKKMGGKKKRMVEVWRRDLIKLIEEDREEGMKKIEKIKIVKDIME